MVQRDDPEALEAFLSGPGGRMLAQDDLARGLMAAAEKCYEQCASLLLKAGAKPDLHDSSGITPLIAACKQVGPCSLDGQFVVLSISISISLTVIVGYYPVD